MGFPRKEYWSGLPCPPHPEIETASLMSPPLVGRFFTTNDTWEPYEEVGAAFFPVTKHSVNEQINELNNKF